MITVTRNWRDIKPPVGSTVDWSHPLSKGLGGCWLFNESSGNTVIDLASNNFKGKIIQPVPRWVGGALRFNGGTADYLSIPLKYTGGYFTVLKDQTFSFLSKCNLANPNYEGLLNAANSASNAIILYYDTAGATSNGLSWKYSNGASNPAFHIDASNPIDTSLWHNITITSYTKRGTINPICRLFVDGKENVLTTGDALSVTENTGIHIARGGTTSLNGAIDINYFYLHNRLLTPDEIRRLHESPYQFIKPSVNRIFSSGGTSAPVVSSGWQYVTQLSTMGCG